MNKPEQRSDLLGEPVHEVEPGVLHPRNFPTLADYWEAVHAAEQDPYPQARVIVESENTPTGEMDF